MSKSLHISLGHRLQRQCTQVWFRIILGVTSLHVRLYWFVVTAPFLFEPYVSQITTLSDFVTY